MSIEKKSLISTLKTTKKTNVVASSELNPKASNVTSKKMAPVAALKRGITSNRKVKSARAMTKRQQASKVSFTYQQIEV